MAKLSTEDAISYSSVFPDNFMRYRSAELVDNKWQSEMILQEQSPNSPPKEIELQLLAEDGQLWIRPQGYGEKCTADSEGSPIGIEIWQDRLRLIAFWKN